MDIISTGPTALKASVKRSSRVKVDCFEYLQHIVGVWRIRVQFILIVNSPEGVDYWIYELAQIVHKVFGKDGAAVRHYVCPVLFNVTYEAPKTSSQITNFPPPVLTPPVSRLCIAASFSCQPVTYEIWGETVKTGRSKGGKRLLR